MNIREMYLSMFDEMPTCMPLMANYDDPIFEDLMMGAIARGTPLTRKEIFDAYENKIDLIKDDFDNEEFEF